MPRYAPVMMRMRARLISGSSRMCPGRHVATVEATGPPLEAAAKERE